MRITLSFFVAVGLGCAVVQPASAQTPWQRFTSLFKKNQADAPQTTVPSADMRGVETRGVETRGAPSAVPSGAREGRGIIFVEEPKSPAPPPRYTGWSRTAPRPPARPPVAPRMSVQPASIPSASIRSAPNPPASSPSTARPAAPVSQPQIVTPSITTNAAVAPATAKSPPTVRDVQRLTRLVSQACPTARGCKISFNTAGELTVELQARTVEECSSLAEQIFTVRELDPYRVNLKFHVAQTQK
ncbi:MAG: hypothetical protein L0Y71_02910 [Gemmataceae bacterium]|nr:hypothetical protein [Gemmataceae bacterium]